MEYPEITSAGGVLINDEGHVLFCHPTGASWSRWALPKGQMNAGETTEQAALREVLEETGYKCAIVLPLTVGVRYKSRGMSGTIMKRLVMYLMRPLAKIQEPDWEHDKFQWVGFEKVGLYASERERPIVEEAIRLHELANPGRRLA